MISEPTTVLTDYALAAVSLVLARGLARAGAAGSGARRLWSASFVTLAIAAFLGGTWHGLGADGPAGLRHAMWSITYVAIGLCDLLLLAGAARALPRGARTAALALLALRFSVYAVLVVERRSFGVVAWEYGGTLLLLFCFGLHLAWRGQRAGRYVLGGALVSFAGGLVLALRLSPHSQFNSNDLFHVVQIAGLGFLYKAGLLLSD